MVGGGGGREMLFRTFTSRKGILFNIDRYDFIVSNYCCSSKFLFRNNIVLVSPFFLFSLFLLMYTLRFEKKGMWSGEGGGKGNAI